MDGDLTMGPIGGRQFGNLKVSGRKTIVIFSSLVSGRWEKGLWNLFLNEFNVFWKEFLFNKRVSLN